MISSAVCWVNRTPPSPSSTLQIPQLCFPAVLSSCYSCPGLCSPYLHARDMA